MTGYQNHNLITGFQGDMKTLLCDVRLASQISLDVILLIVGLGVKIITLNLVICKTFYAISRLSDRLYKV